VTFLTDLPDRLVPAVYRHALLFVYPTWAEGFGMPVLEAMASGVPVITSGNSALPEVAGEAAMFVDPEDTRGLGMALERLLVDASLRAEMILKGEQRISSFTWNKSADALREWYLDYFSKARGSDLSNG